MGQLFKQLQIQQTRDNISDSQRLNKQKQNRTIGTMIHPKYPNTRSMYQMPALRNTKKSITTLPVSNINNPDKEDLANQANTACTSSTSLITFQKVPIRSTPATNPTAYPSIQISKKIERKVKLRISVISKYSKLQFSFSLQMESFFLAVDIFDRYVNICGDQIVRDWVEVAVACFMIAVKYEEIYPPSLEQIQTRFGTNIDFRSYVQLQLEILNTLQFNISLESPLQYFPDFQKDRLEQMKDEALQEVQEGSEGTTDQSNMEKMSKEVKLEVFLYLELACLNYEIKRKYTWRQIMEAISLLMMSLSQLRQRSSQASEEVKEIEKLLILEKSKMENQHYWLQRKYSDCRYNRVMAKQLTQEEQE